MMNLTLSEAHQDEMRVAYYEGAPGVFVSGLVWLAAALVCALLGMRQAVWTLLIGGALIYPVSAVLTRALGRAAKTGPANALNGLAMASTIWLILNCAMAYGLFLSTPALFFPAMMATIGSRYLVFASIYGRAIFWVMGACLMIAAALVYCSASAPVVAAGIGGLIELVFALFIFLKAPKPAGALSGQAERG